MSRELFVFRCRLQERNSRLSKMEVESRCQNDGDGDEGGNVQRFPSFSGVGDSRKEVQGSRQVVWLSKYLGTSLT